MFTRWQLVLLGLVISQGAGLKAMDKATSSPRNRLSHSQDAKMKRPAEKILEESLQRIQKKSRYGCGRNCFGDPILAEALKNDPRIEWLPI